MSKRPKLTEIERRLQTGNPFQLTREQYIAATGIDIPQKKSYTENASSLAKMAKKYGYKVHVIPEILVFEKEGV